MKTSEFIEKVTALEGVGGFFENEECLYLYSSNHVELVASVDKEERFVLSTIFYDFSELSFFSQGLLLDLLYQYATTPLEEREEPKKYKLRHKLVEFAYLNYLKRDKELIFSTGEQIGAYETDFTIQEWESLTEQTWEDLLLQFKAIEV